MPSTSYFSRLLICSIFICASLIACGQDAGQQKGARSSAAVKKEAAQKSQVAKTLVTKLNAKKTDVVTTKAAVAKSKKEAPKAVNVELPEQFKGKQVTFATVQEQTQEAIAVAQEFFTQREKEYHSKIEAELLEFNKRISEMQKRAAETAEKAKAKVSTELTQLRQQMNVTTSQLVEVNKLSEKEMDQLSGQLRSYIDELQNKAPNSEVPVK